MPKHTKKSLEKSSKAQGQRLASSGTKFVKSDHEPGDASSDFYDATDMAVDPEQALASHVSDVKKIG